MLAPWSEIEEKDVHLAVAHREIRSGSYHDAIKKAKAILKYFRQAIFMRASNAREWLIWDAVCVILCICILEEKRI